MENCPYSNDTAPGAKITIRPERTKIPLRPAGHVKVIRNSSGDPLKRDSGFHA